MENIMSSKLFTTRQGTVLLGVIAAVIAAIALIVYLNHYRNSVNGNRDRSQVLVAKKLIQQGTSGRRQSRIHGLLRAREHPEEPGRDGRLHRPVHAHRQGRARGHLSRVSSSRQPTSAPPSNALADAARPAPAGRRGRRSARRRRSADRSRPAATSTSG